MRMVSYHQIRSCIHQPAGSPLPPVLGRMGLLLPAMVEDNLKIRILLRFLNPADNLVRLSLVPQAMADHSNPIALLLKIKGPAVAAIQQPGSLYGRNGVLGALRAIIACVVVG